MSTLGIGRAAIWMAGALAYAGGAYGAVAEFDEQNMVAIVAALSGEQEIAPGVLLRDRYTDMNRQQTRSYLSAQIASLGIAARTHAYRAQGVNVFGVLPKTRQVPGGTPTTVVIGAHFDSVRGVPGANDNATGVALVHGAAAAMATKSCRTRDLMIVYFDEEERGLVGSDRFARWLKEQGTAVHSVHTVDQMGWDEDGDRAVELELPHNSLRPVYEQAAARLNIKVQRTSTSSTDHASFRAQGFAAVGLTEEYVNGDTTPYYHQAGDKFATVNFDYLASSGRLFTEVLSELVGAGCAHFEP